MNKQNLIIYDFIELYSILNEIKTNLKFKLLNISKSEFSKTQFNKFENFLIISKKKICNYSCWMERSFFRNNRKYYKRTL